MPEKICEEKYNVPAHELPVKPLTIEELEKSSSERVSLIADEFKRGFEFIKKYPRSVTFFGSSRFNEENPFYQDARALSKLIVTSLNYAIVTGGGPGIMEAANRGAMDADGHSVGLSIKLPREQRTNAYLSDFIDFYYFFSRKVTLSFSAEAYIFYPGGVGTLDEFFEIFTLVQTHKIACCVPMILVGEAFWKPLDTFIRETLYEKMHTISKEDPDYYLITDDHKKIVETIRKAPLRI